MEVQLLEGLHHAWRGRMGLVLHGFEREGNSREQTPSQRLLQYSGESRNLNPMFRISELSQGSKLQTTCSLNKTVQTWVKHFGLKVTCAGCVFTRCPRMLRNETWQKKGKWKKEQQRSTPKMLLIFQLNKKGAWEEQKYPKRASKTMSEDQYRPGFKAANILRRVGLTLD